MRTLVIVATLLLLPFVSQAQWKTGAKEKVSAGESLVRTDGGGLLFGWFDPARFSMHHSYSLSYTSFGGRGISVGEYTNRMTYQLSDPLSVLLDVSVAHSPFNSFGDKFGSEMSGVRISRAQIDYRPSENTHLQLQFRQVPLNGYLTGFDYPFMNRFGSDTFAEPSR